MTKINSSLLLAACFMITSLFSWINNSKAATVTEITTGEMLGYTQLDQRRSFYIKINGGAWEKTYSDPIYKTAAQGKLMNIRCANALFDDESNLAISQSFDPDANTNNFIAQLDSYKAHGVLSFNMCLQGGFPGYEGAIASAFNSDGSLKPAWMDRCDRVIKAANERNMIVQLALFYQRQDQILTDNNAVKEAVKNVCDWLIINNHRNVIIEVANEYYHSGFNNKIISTNAMTNGIGELIGIIKTKFTGLGWSLPISASGLGGNIVSGTLKSEENLCMYHGNSTSPATDIANIKTLYNDITVHGPVITNEDDNGSSVNSTTLNNEKTTATGIFNEGGSWGLMWATYNQDYPFYWVLGATTDISGGSEANYFHAVLDHILSLVKADVILPSVFISASATTIKTGASTTITPTLSNFVNSIASYQWNWGGTLENGTGNPSASKIKTFATKGVYNVTLSVTDNASPAKTYTSPAITINVVDNFPPVISKVMYELSGTLDINTATDRTFIAITEGKALDFYAQGSDADNDSITYVWDLDGDGIFETPGQSVQKTFSTLGTINGSIRLSDATGSDIHAVNIKVNSLKGPFIEVAGLVTIEAENFTTNEIRTDVANTEWFRSTSIPIFSGDDYITTQDNGAANGAWATAAETTYDIKFQTTGTYYVWLRRYNPDASSNSFYAGVDGVELTGKGDATYGSWGWYSPGTFTVSAAGVKTFQIRRREDGFMLDKIVISNNATYDPSIINGGLGPVESLNVTTAEQIYVDSEKVLLDIFPNPAFDFVTIASKYQIISIEICNQSGNIIKSFYPKSTLTKVSVEDIPKGTYIITAQLIQKDSELLKVSSKLILK